MNSIIENISKGNWEIGNVSDTYPKYIPVFEVIDDGINKPFRNVVCECVPKIHGAETRLANAQLIADAGTTANICGYLPSELLEQNKDLLEATINLQKRLEFLINITPSGIERNSMCDENIICLELIQKSTL